MPQDVEYYVHRIGRTARAGREGTAISFVSPREMNTLSQIQKFKPAPKGLKIKETRTYWVKRP